jgi:outer membrane protein
MRQEKNMHCAVRKLIIILVLLFFLFPLSLFSLDVSLESAREETRKNSEAIRLKLMEIEEKKYSLAEAEARRFPEIKMQASATYMTDPPEGITIPKGMFGYTPTYNSEAPVPFPDRDYVLIEDPENTYFKMTATLTQPVYTWNKISNAIKIARDDVAVSECAYDQAIQEISHEVVKIYMSLVLVKKSLPILEKLENVLSEILDDREKSYAEGYINLQKVLEVQSNRAAMEAQYIQARESYRSGMEAFAFYTGIEADTISLTTSFRTTLPEFNEDDLKAHALAYSHDVNIMRKKLDQALTLIKIEKGSDLFRPDVSFVVSVDVSGGRIPVIGANWTDTWDHNITFTLGTEVKLFDGGKSGLEIKQAENKRDMAVTGLDQMEKGLALGIRRGIQEARVAYYTVKEKEAKTAELREQYKNARVSYENDLATREEERGARVLLYKTELEYVLAQYEYELALGELEFLTGVEF